VIEQVDSRQSTVNSRSKVESRKSKPGEEKVSFDLERSTFDERAREAARSNALGATRC
jgi:hypothetical protein